jgi:hypothetical protein
LVDFIFIQGIKNGQSLLYAFRDHDFIPCSRYPATVGLS